MHTETSMEKGKASGESTSKLLLYVLIFGNLVRMSVYLVVVRFLFVVVCCCFVAVCCCLLLFVVVVRCVDLCCCLQH